jgi:TATA-box binding protein (TBP) (component of TFIID and TFIIIB)
MKILFKEIISLILMVKIDWNNYNYIEIIEHNENEIKNLPKGVSISTMCASCKINSLINITNIEKYLQLDSDDILCVKINDDNKRTLLPDKKKNKRIVKTQKDVNEKHFFFNQITVIIRVGSGIVNDWTKEPKINLKLFKNGSIQMSGCKSLSSINIVLNKLIVKLKEIKAKIENGKIIEKKYVENNEQLAITCFKIDMINSNYRVNMQIDRANLNNLLLKKKIKSSFEPCIRACVIIKYIPNKSNNEGKEISIFVFQKGNIIITGARTKDHILSAYEYINKILIEHYDEIKKKDEKEEEKNIMEIYNKNLLNNIKSCNNIWV